MVLAHQATRLFQVIHLDQLYHLFRTVLVDLSALEGLQVQEGLEVHLFRAVLEDLSDLADLEGQ